MQTQDFERVTSGTVRVELCFPCAGIWFDHMASVELAPAAVIELFKEIQSHRADARQPVANRLACPRCDDALAPTSDFSEPIFKGLGTFVLVHDASRSAGTNARG
jgi:hypothetical protein